MDTKNAATLFKTISGIVHNAARLRHGCAIVVDLNTTPVSLSSQCLEHPLDLNNHDELELAKSLSRMDGALHIGVDLKLHGFACLLDGHYIPNEHRARGARFNSALRFTAEHENIIVIVVSSDSPVSVMRSGMVLDGKWRLKPSIFCNAPMLLKKWVVSSDSEYY
jgi:DNA integrity scanning protein DisA with diadenylate cyclase activity